MKAQQAQTSAPQSYVDFQREGERGIREGRYEAAKISLDQAVLLAARNAAQRPSVLIMVLDFRLEALLRLEQYDEALKDARTIVRLDRTSPRGYLRCGQLHGLKTEYKMAQKWCEQGLKNISINDGLYARLQSMLSKTVSKLREEARRDPFLTLPMEILHMLWDYLDFRQSTRCLRVSKTWRNTLHSMPGVWKTLDVTGATKEVLAYNLMASLRRMSTPPNTVRLQGLTSAAVTYIGPYLKRWKSMEYLSIAQTGLLDLQSPDMLQTLKSLHVGKSCPIVYDNLEDLLHCCPMLRYAHFDHVVDFNRASSAPFRRQDLQPHYKTILPELNHLVLLADPVQAEYLFVSVSPISFSPLFTS
jgi:tetratricopeptide (TPR) repeat protein